MKSSLKAALALFALALLVPALGVLTPAGSTVPGASAAVRQSGKTMLMPQIVQPGAKVAGANNARLTGTVRFRPIRKGRPVVIQRKLGGGAWRKVTTVRQNGRGMVDFVGPAKSRGKWFSYRGVAQRWNGLGSVAAKPQSAGIWGAQPRFSDEFKGTALDSSKWALRQEGEYNPPGRACSTSTADAVTVGGGRVSLWVRKHPARQAVAGTCDAADGNVHSNRNWFQNGHIGTAGKYEFRYGVAAARVKFDKPEGAHGSFWMQSTVADRNGVGPAGDGAEIDVVEYFGKGFKKGDIYSFVHYRDAGDNERTVPSSKPPITAARKALRGDDDWFKKYHVFSVEWTPSSYVFRVDGIRTLKITKGVSRIPEYMILSMLSSDWELSSMNQSTLPNATQVDWVRVWQK